MAVVAVNAREGRLENEGCLVAALQSATRLRAVTVMIHGYRFCPFSGPLNDPHRHILSETPMRGFWKAVSWPRHLRFAQGDVLGVALGWPARGGLAGAYARASDAGAALARIARIAAAQRPGLPVNVIAHSLGARVALAALPHLPGGALSRLILLSGAEYFSRAAAALDCPAGRAARVLNVTSRENLPFDAGFRAAIRPPGWRDLPLAAGLREQAGWIDLRIDCPGHAARLEGMGFRLRPPASRFCHWSGYMRPGVFALYRAALDDPGEALFTRLRAALAPPLREPAPARRLARPA